ncbi:uncharacterized protein LOC106670097 isoform X1 [Cimex lectularius]|uniref:Uncharacterized protein n=2 Tax=Cimex lectularius TaxID=79782 RepID=A0A8I6S4G3_CIMLE|nr:uncharacterized protein LOC106670097 isoform X1 [Cimex lectularius]
MSTASLPQDPAAMTKGGGSDSESEASVEGYFLTRGAFLLTPSHDLNMDKAATILDKMNFKGPFSLTKTATGILFKFADPEDYQATYKKGFHKVTGARFYKKVPIPCRPQKTFVVLVLDVPEDLPEEDIRHSLYKFQSVVEVSRVHSVPVTNTTDKCAPPTPGSKQDKAADGYSPPLVRITLASMDECHTLLQNGLDFYGATYFPTEPGPNNALLKVVRKTSTPVYTSRLWETGGKVRDLLPVFDAAGFTKIPPPPSKTIKPRN